MGTGGTLKREGAPGVWAGGSELKAHSGQWTWNLRAHVGDCPGSPVVKTLCFRGRGRRFNPCCGVRAGARRTKIPSACEHSQKKKRERTGVVFERGRWNRDDEEPAVLEGVWQALQITRGASSAVILKKSYFFHSESSLAPGIRFSTDMLKEGAWKALRGRMALPLQKGWLRIPQSPSRRPRTTASSAPSLRPGSSCSGWGSGSLSLCLPCV